MVELELEELDELQCLYCGNTFVARKGFGACCSEECSELYGDDEEV